jgi:hypothetical protein
VSSTPRRTASRASGVRRAGCAQLGLSVDIDDRRASEFYELAIIGGTNLYDNVRGSMTATRYTRGPRREILIFRLIV